MICNCSCHTGLTNDAWAFNCCVCTTVFGPIPDPWAIIDRAKLRLEKGHENKGIEKTETCGKVSASSVGGKTILSEIDPKCKVILADPPWQFRDKLDPTRNISKFYSTLSLKDLSSFDLSGVADSTCVLLMWAPNSMLPEALSLMKDWDFKYSTNFVWVKPRMGMGHTFRSAHETLLLGLKGKRHMVKFKGQPSWSLMPVQDHSHKPEEVYEIIERMFDGPYLELFARRPRTGWLSFGDQLV